MRARSATDALSSLDAASIESVEVVKLAPGRLTPDSVSVIWVEMKRPGATRVTAPGRAARVDTAAAPTRTAAPTDRPARVRVRDGAQPSGDPILVVDGAVVDSGVTMQQALARIPTDSIDSVEVLKGAAATGRYGENARHGVVIVTTKRQKGASR